MEVYSAYLRFVDPPVGHRHRGPPKTLQNWKRKRRWKDAKNVPLVACEWCGGNNKLDRHHDWQEQKVPVKPVVLCHPCHDTADGRRRARCSGCNYEAPDLPAYRIHVERCPKIERSVVWVAGRIVSGW